MVVQVSIVNMDTAVSRLKIGFRRVSDGSRTIVHSLPVIVVSGLIQVSSETEP